MAEEPNEKRGHDGKEGLNANGNSIPCRGLNGKMTHGMGYSMAMGD